jgi:hypothetical protein
MSRSQTRTVGPARTARGPVAGLVVGLVALALLAPVGAATADSTVTTTSTATTSPSPSPSPSNAGWQ